VSARRAPVSCNRPTAALLGGPASDYATAVGARDSAALRAVVRIEPLLLP